MNFNDRLINNHFEGHTTQNFYKYSEQNQEKRIDSPEGNI